MAFKFLAQKYLLLFLLVFSGLLLGLPLLNQLTQINAGYLQNLLITVEFFSVFVSVSIVLILLQRTDVTEYSLINTLLVSFTIISMLNYFQILAYQHAAGGNTLGSAAKVMFFEFGSRSIELLAMLSIAWRLKLAGRKMSWVLVGLVISLSIAYIGFYQIDKLAGKAQLVPLISAINVDFEYAFLLASIVLFIVFVRRYQSLLNTKYLYFSLSCAAMTLCSFTLIIYAPLSNAALLTSYLFQMIAAVFVYVAIYWGELKRPYQVAKLAVQSMDKKDAQLQTILSNIPIGIIRLDRSYTILYYNAYLEQMTSLVSESLVGKSLHDSLLSKVSAIITPHLKQAFLGEHVKFDYEYVSDEQQFVSRAIILVPEKNAQGEVQSVLFLALDTSSKNKAVQEAEKLRRALDEHAIVATTDINGVITSVNEKFCQISQYTRDELIGNTHRIINSGYHSGHFFNEMWKTIAQGDIWHAEVCNKAKDGSFYWVNTTIVPVLDKQGKISEYISVRADITKRKLAETTARRLAYFDDLTGLANRRSLKDQLELLRNQQQLGSLAIHALLLIDLDDFKNINDTLGHVAGDELLKQVASRLRKFDTQTIFVARLGGDEFVLLIKDLAQDKHCAYTAVVQTAEQIRQALAAPYQIEKQTVTTSASIGVALFDGSEDSTSEFLKQADIAMYQSKKLGKDLVSFFDPELQIELDQRNVLQNELSKALKRQEFVLLYQPIYNQQQYVIGCEALIRWHNKKLGAVSPAQFIPQAEQSNLILDIGDWVLNTACQQLVEWASDEKRQHWSIAVNVSARQLQQVDFVETVKKTVAKHGANPQRLKLEITESMLQESIEETILAMRELQHIGIRFSLDDFGTGFSSLSYLTKLPIDTLKIDGSFVNNMLNSQGDEAVVAMILSLSSALNLDVVAEGVETQEQLSFLMDQGCQSFQGYLLSKPCSAQAIANL